MPKLPLKAKTPRLKKKKLRKPTIILSIVHISYLNSVLRSRNYIITILQINRRVTTNHPVGEKSAKCLNA